MIRNIKALGLALVAVFAMSALAASAAQATTGVFEWGAGATKFKATQDDAPNQNQSFSITGGTLTFTCNEIHAAGTFPKEGLASSETLQTSELTYANNGSADTCPSNTGLSPKIEINGCNYLFHAGETLAAGELTATVDLVCPDEKGITVNAGLACNTHVEPQVGLKHVVLRNEPTTPETVTGEATVTGIKYIHTGLCGSGTKEDGTYNGKFTIKGENNAGVQKDVTVT